MGSTCTGKKVSLSFCLQTLQQSSEGDTIVPTLKMRTLRITVVFLKVWSWTVLVSPGPICGPTVDILWGEAQHSWVLTSVLKFENHCFRELKRFDLPKSHTDGKGRAGNWTQASNANLSTAAHFLMLGSQSFSHSLKRPALYKIEIQ